MRALIASFLLLGVATALAQEPPLKDVALDRSAAAVRRGALVVANVCMECHSLRYVRYRDLLAVEVSEDELTAIRGERASEDAMLSVMGEESALASFGRVPPDQSTLAKSRAGGARYIYTFVTAFERSANGEVVNRLSPETKMPDVLGYARSEGNERAAVEQRAQDAAVFLEWASDPRAAQRKALGSWVLGYLVVLTVLLYFIKRRVWKGISP